MTLSTQFMTMLAMIIMGSVSGVAFDTYTRLIRRSRTRSILLFFHDVLFWLFQALLAFYVLFRMNEGEVRLYIFLALLCGYAAYQSLLKNSYLRLLETIISMITSTYRTIVKIIQTIILKPIYALTLLLLSMIVVVAKGLWTLVAFIYHALLYIIKGLVSVILRPIRWIGLILYKIIPISVTKAMKRLYNRGNHLKVNINKQIKSWLSQMNIRK